MPYRSPGCADVLRGERADVTDVFLMTLVDTSVVKHNMLTLRMCNINCFSTDAMVTRTRLVVTFSYIACLAVASFVPPPLCSWLHSDRFRSFPHVRP